MKKFIYIIPLICFISCVKDGIFTYCGKIIGHGTTVVNQKTYYYISVHHNYTVTQKYIDSLGWVKLKQGEIYCWQVAP